MTPTREAMIEAVKAGLVLQIQHKTGDRTNTIREIVPIGIGTRKGKLYFRAIHLNGGSESGARRTQYRLFKQDNLSDMKWLNGKTYGGLNPNNTATPRNSYTFTDSFFSVLAWYDWRKARKYYIDNRDTIIALFRDQ